MIARLRKLASQHAALVYSAVAIGYVVFAIGWNEPTGAIGAAILGWVAGLITGTDDGDRRLASERQQRDLWYVHRGIVDRYFVPRDRNSR